MKLIAHIEISLDDRRAFNEDQGGPGMSLDAALGDALEALDIPGTSISLDWLGQVRKWPHAPDESPGHTHRRYHRIG